MYRCEVCNRTFSRNFNLQRHLAGRQHIQATEMEQGGPPPMKKKKIVTPPKDPGLTVRLIHRELGDLFKIYRLQTKNRARDILVLSGQIQPHITYLLHRVVAETNGVKAQLRLTLSFYKAVDPETASRAYFNSKQTIFLPTTDVEAEYTKAIDEMQRLVDKYTRDGSGWVVDVIHFCDVYISRYNPIQGRTYVPVPPKLRTKKAIVNVKNNDQKCFMWSVLAGLYEAHDHSDRLSNYKPYQDQLNFDGIPFPVSLDDIPKFEEQNNIGINVLGYTNEKLHPLYSTKTRDIEIINLLLLTPEDGPHHYCLIKNLNRLLFQSTKHKNSKHICQYCLCSFNTEARLLKHQEYCTADKQRVELPEEPILKFTSVQKQLRAPYVLYADFECYLQKLSDVDDDNERLHVPNSYGLIGVKQCCDQKSFDEPIIYRGDNPVLHFLTEAIAKGEQYVRDSKVPMVITDAEQYHFEDAEQCYLCKGRFLGEKHRDHCHVCGKYRGAAHAKCNLKAKTSREVTVFFHNLRRYDGHLVMQEIGTILQRKGMKMECVAKGMEDYISFYVRVKTDNIGWKLKFVDSCAFLSASLDNLAQILPRDKLDAVTRFAEKPELLARKGIYPYDYVDDASHFQERQLPPKEKFYNKLTKQHVTSQDYEHAQTVWRELELQTFGQYHDAYLLADVLLLADIFENFRERTLQNYGLDPANYITLPSLAWDALLKFTGVELELLQDPDMYFFFTAGIRGGISVISHRYAKANNPYLPDYDQRDPHSYIMYLDANNLYGWAMMQKLPVGNFEWVGEMEEMPDDGYGYVLEVDLEYPPHLHVTHNCYPLAAERTLPSQTSAYCQKLQEELNLKDAKTEKLIPNLMDKEKYIIHHESLKQCLALGLKLKKIHRGIRFEERAWMAPYINFNTEQRKLATNSFDKDLFKLFNNAVFGKSMENIFNYITVKLIADARQFERLVASPLFRQTVPFKNDLHAVLMARESATLSKPIYTGFAILELSKTLMYNFHYNYIVKDYGTDATLLFTDTDSLCYKIFTDDIYEDMLLDRDEYFDTSDYPKNHQLHSEKNKKVIGMMKDETNGEPISEFVGLRSKMYSIKCGSVEKKRAKGINKAVVKKDITHDDYKTTLLERHQMRHEMLRFKSMGHEITTMEMVKTSLSPYDDKRYILDDGITSYAYGHKNIPEDDDDE